MQSVAQRSKLDHLKSSFGAQIDWAYSVGVQWAMNSWSTFVAGKTYLSTL